MRPAAGMGADMREVLPSGAEIVRSVCDTSVLAWRFVSMICCCRTLCVQARLTGFPLPRAAVEPSSSATRRPPALGGQRSLRSSMPRTASLSRRAGTSPTQFSTPLQFPATFIDEFWIETPGPVQSHELQQQQTELH